MKYPPPRSWSLSERIDGMEHKGIIEVPFTPDERDLARNLAAAYYFLYEQKELPTRALEGDGVSSDFTPELWAFDQGIVRVRHIRGDLQD